MKKLLFSLFLIALVISFSCEKRKACYECTTVTQLDYCCYEGCFTKTTETATIYCDVTAKDIKQIEKEETYETTTQGPYSPNITKARTTCKIQ